MDALKEEWGAWLGTMQWDWFLTITFRKPVPFLRQEPVVHAAGNVLAATYVTERIFLAAEPHLSYDTHLHGLFKSGIDREDVKGFQRKAIWQTLYEMFGRTDVSVPLDQGDVANYVSKYCVKGSGYYELWGASDGRAAEPKLLPGSGVGLV